MELIREEILAFVEGRLLPGMSDPSRLVQGNLLNQYRPPQLKDWILQLRGTHRRISILEWCVATIFLHAPELDPDLEFTSLLLPRSDLEYDVLKRVPLFSQNFVVIEIPEQGDENLTRIWNQSNRVHRGFKPRVWVSAKWDPIRVKEKAFIGKGYNDKGSIAEGPSWQEQMLTAEEPFLQLPTKFFKDLLSLE